MGAATRSGTGTQGNQMGILGRTVLPWCLATDSNGQTGLVTGKVHSSATVMVMMTHG